MISLFIIRIWHLDGEELLIKKNHADEMDTTDDIN